MDSTPLTEGEELEQTSYDLEQSDYEMVRQIGNFEYMPSTFRSIVTQEFGMMSRRYDEEGNRLEEVELHPFYKLKEIALSSTEDISDRMQSVRYMCFIPHIHHDSECLEAAKGIVSDESIDIYRRFHFFSNNEKYFKLTDLLVHQIHPFFFERGLELKYPFELLIRSARYILSFYDNKEDLRQNVLNWLIDISDDEYETHRVRAETADVLITCGEPDEIEFGMQIISQLKGSEDLYENEENVHNDGMSLSCKKIIRALQSDVSVINTPSVGLDVLFDLALIYADEYIDKQHIQDFFYRVQTDPTRFERLTLSDILDLVYRKLSSMRASVTEEEYSKLEGLIGLRLFQEINDSVDTCATGYMTRILNIMRGIVPEKDFELRVHPKDEIRSVVFARLNMCLRQLGAEEQHLILESIQSEDKSHVDEFLRCYDLREELWEEYQSLVNESEFELIVQEALDQYIGKRG